MARTINFSEIVARYQPDLLPQFDTDAAYVFDRKVFPESRPMPPGVPLSRGPRQTFTFGAMIEQLHPGFLHKIDLQYEFSRGRRFYRSGPRPAGAPLSKPARRSTTFNTLLKTLETIDVKTGNPIRFRDWAYIFNNGRRFLEQEPLYQGYSPLKLTADTIRITADTIDYTADQTYETPAQYEARTGRTVYWRP